MNVIRFLLSVLCLAVLSAFPARADEAVFARVSETKTVNCGYFLWPPYISKDPNTGKLSGINYDIMEAIARNLGLKLNWSSEIGVGDAVAALESNKIDVVCASIWPSPARVFALTLSNPTFYSAAYAFTRGDDKRFDGDLSKANNKNVKVSSIDGDFSHDLALEKLNRATMVALPETASGSELLMQVTTGKSDLFFSDEGLVNDYLKTHPGSLRKVEGTGPVRYYGETIAVKHGEYALRDMINLAILQLSNDGDLEKIVEKYRRQYKSEWYAPAKTLKINR